MKRLSNNKTNGQKQNHVNPTLFITHPHFFLSQTFALCNITVATPSPERGPLKNAEASGDLSTAIYLSLKNPEVNRWNLTQRSLIPILFYKFHFHRFAGIILMFGFLVDLRFGSGDVAERGSLRQNRGECVINKVGLTWFNF